MCGTPTPTPKMTPKRTILLLSILLGLSFGALATQLPTLTRSPTYLHQLALAAILPGLLLSHALTGDAHAAPIATFLFYFFLSWITGQLLIRLLPTPAKP